MKIKKRLIIRSISYLFVICFILSGYLVKKNNESIKYKSQLKNIYLHQISDFSHYLSNIETNLVKEIYSGTIGSQSKIAANLLSDAISAKDALSEIPFKDSSMNDIYNFLSKVEDFSKYIISNEKTNNTGDTFDMFSYKLNQLLSYTKKVTVEFKNIANSVNNIDEIDDSLLTEEINIINNKFNDYEELSSNGPYNYHINNIAPRVIENKEIVSKEDAKRHVSEFINAPEDSIEFTNELEGNIPSYVFTVGNSTVSVTKSGGLILYYTNPVIVTKRNLSHTEAADKAKEFLNQKGIEDMEETYFSISGNVCTINYVYYKDKILYYNDLIKVSISLDNGDIVGFQSTGYIMNHFKREFKTDYISEVAARRCLNPNLNVIKSMLSCITIFNDQEDLCYEFECESNNNKIIVYINAFNKTEEDILILTDNENNKFII